MSHIGHIEPFDETTSDWRSYEERLKAYLLVNDVPVAKKVPAFLSLIGAKTYALLKSLTAPDAPSSREFDSLLKLLSNHLAPQSSVIAERAKFYKRSQRSDPFTVPVNVDGVLLTMELDTGAAVSVISWREFQRLFPRKRLQPASLKLRTYTGAIVKPKGLAKVVVRHNDQCVELPLYVVDSTGPALLGREWLQDIRLDWKNLVFFNHLGLSREISKHWQEKLEAMLESHSELFKDELGTITEEQAELVLREGSQPKFVKARSVPFALQRAVEAELVKMEKLGIITPVATSEYATPLVPVVKRDGSLRLCGDYKTTVNPCLEVDRYPLPRIDDLLAALAGGEEFSKIDLSRAYQQVVMAEGSRKLLTINTHKGLYTMNRLAFGISSAPSIFQRIMDNMLKGLEGVSCYLDDILVTGKTKREHFRNLEAVLSRLQERGVRIRRDKCSFFQRELRYLGHVINAEGVCASPEKVLALLNAPAPKDKQQLQSFLGMVNYYGKFVQRL
nr:uncharacterized protein K02A2.6-like [Dermacentor andersoni]